ncbi:MAG: hypothetical protein ABNH00_10980 [Dokdonia sp.]|jgi:hypothetical protein
MEEQFIHIATVLFEHEYFTNGVLETVEVTAQTKTLRTLKNLGILIKPFKGGIHMLTSNVEGLSTFTEDLRFEMRCRDAYFINYTTLPQFQPAQDICYFSNKESQEMAESPKLGLHESFVGKKDILTAYTEAVVLDSFHPDSNYTFETAAGVLDAWQVQQPNVSENKFIFYNVPEGIVQVKGTRSEPENFYYSPDVLWHKPIGIIEIAPHQLYKHYKAKTTTVQYVVTFAARQTFWEYYFSYDTLASLENIAIIKSNKQQDFKHVGTDQNSMIYRAAAPRKLSQTNQENLQLAHNFSPQTVLDRSYDLIINQLPIPSPNQLFPNSDNPSDPTAALYSRIYIHF